MELGPTNGADSITISYIGSYTKKIPAIFGKHVTVILKDQFPEFEPLDTFYKTKNDTVIIEYE